MGPQQFLFDEQGCPWGRGGKMHVDVFFWGLGGMGVGVRGRGMDLAMP